MRREVADLRAEREFDRKAYGDALDRSSNHIERLRRELDDVRKAGQGNSSLQTTLQRLLEVQQQLIDRQQRQPIQVPASR